MDDNNFRDFAIDFIESGGSRDEILEYFNIKESTYYSWRSRGQPSSRTDEISRFFVDDNAIVWGESVDLSSFLKGTIYPKEDFLNIPPNLLPNIFTPRGHLWLTGVMRIRWIGGPLNGKAFDEIFSRTTNNQYNYPAEAVPRLNELIEEIFEPRIITTKEGSYTVLVDWIKTDGGIFYNADDDPFSYIGQLIWNTKYTDINVSKGRKESSEIKGRRRWNT